MSEKVDYPTTDDFSGSEKVVDRILEHISSEGPKTISELSTVLSVDESELSPVITTLVEVDVLRPETEDGADTTFAIGENNNSVELVDEPVTEQDTTMKVDRDYDFKSRIPQNVPEFHQNTNELDEMMADLKGNRIVAENEGVTHARLPRYWVTGPTGCGKTLAAQNLAEQEDAALFTIQGRYSMNEADLLGSPLLINGETVWVDGPLTKALIASQEMPVVLLIDEANRARPESKSVLFSVLDDRCQVELDALGGDIIEGNPMNLISYATINEGPGYQTQKLDLAEMRRFGLRYQMNHLGLQHRDDEVNLIANRSLVGKNLANYMVDMANKLRKEAGDDGSGPGEIKRGVPTALLLNWAQTAYAYEQGGINNPVLKAMEAAVIRPFYKDDNPSWVHDYAADMLDGAPVEGFSDWKTKDMDDEVSDM